MSLFSFNLAYIFPHSGDSKSYYICNYRPKNSPGEKKSEKHSISMERKEVHRMFEAFIFLLGILVGCIVSQLIARLGAGKGYFRVTKLPEEEELYTVNVRLEPDQQLQKKTRIILKREHSHE